MQSDSAPTDQDTTAQVIDSLQKFRAADAEVERQAAWKDPVLSFVDGPSRLDALLADLDRVRATAYG